MRTVIAYTLLAFIFISLTALSQLPQRRTGYVDLHSHNSMKRYYSLTSKPEDMPASGTSLSTTNWDADKNKCKIKKAKRTGGFSNFKTYTQSSYHQLEKSNATIICTSITPIEKKFASDTKVQLKIYKYMLRIPIKMRKITQKFATGMNAKRLKKLGEEGNSSFDEFMGEYNYLKNHTETNTNHTNTIVLAKNKAHLQQLYAQKKTALILTIEGGHVLHGDRISKKQYYNNPYCDKECEDEILNNIHTLKTLDHRIFFINLGHFAWNKIAGFAKTLDIAEKKLGISLRDELQANSMRSNRFRRTLFTRYGEGIIDTLQNDVTEQLILQDNWKTLSNDSTKKLSQKILSKKTSSLQSCHCQVNSDYVSTIGWKVVNALLDTSNGAHPIYIDLKHLDLQGRKDYLHYLDTAHRTDVPIIASHCAVSGKNQPLAKLTGMCPFPDAYEEITSPQYYYLTQLQNREGCLSASDYQPLKSGWFYPWSINLYDEEISEIISRDGIIGITLEERVLGKDMPNYTSLGRDTSGTHIKHADVLRKYFFAKGYPLSTIDSIAVAEPFLRNMFYMVEYSCTNRPNCNVCDAWNHLAIGSDFDGMMNPIDICPTAADMPAFQKFLETILSDYAAFINKQNLLCKQTPAQLLDKVFFDNGENFILKYFQN